MQHDPKSPIGKVVYANTPRKKCGTNTEMAKLNLKQMRKLVVKTLPDTIPELDVTSFLEILLPFIEAGKVTAIVEKLGQEFTEIVPGRKTRGQSFEPAIVGGRWRWFREEPTVSASNEDTVYRDMNCIFEAVEAAAAMVLGLRPITKTRVQATTADKSESQNGTFKNDANQRLLETTLCDRKDIGPFQHFSADSVTSLEFKKHTKRDSVNANRKQLLGNAAQALFADPCRRFRFGITIENTDMRFWFMSRAMCIVSEPFNFVQNPRPLVHFLASTSFAAKEALGYDPTVRRVKVDSTVTFEWLIQDEDGTEAWYRATGDAIFSHDAHRLLGRAIRVWPVKKVGDPNAETVVLKDYWLTHDSKTERQLQNDIVEAVEKSRHERGVSKDEAEDARKYLMTILHDCAVYVDGKEDNSKHFIRSDRPPRFTEMTLMLPKETSAAAKASIPSTNEKAQGGLKVPEAVTQTSDWPSGSGGWLEHRKHRRLIIKEVGTPLQDVTDHKLLFRSLADAMRGLRIFNEAGFVHRDISTGNLLLCKLDDGTLICKLSDLEYSRPQQLPAGAMQHQPKTGTPCFMAIEVQSACYRYLEEEETPERSSAEPAEEHEFFHNYIHDIEGVWWIAVWSLFYTYPANEIVDKVRSITGLGQLPQEKVADPIFPASLEPSVSRSDFAEKGKVFQMKSAVLPKEYTAVAKIMHSVLLALRSFYKKIEANLQLKFDAKQYAPFYEPLIGHFERAVEQAADSVRFICDVRAELEAELKANKHEEHAEEEQVAADPDASENPTVDEQSKPAKPADAPVARAPKRTREDDPPPSLGAMAPPDFIPGQQGPSKRTRTKSTGTENDSAPPPRRSARLMRTDSNPFVSASSDDDAAMSGHSAPVSRSQSRSGSPRGRGKAKSTTSGRRSRRRGR